MKKSALSIVLAAGIASSAMADDLIYNEVNLKPADVNSMEHIYYNLSTGEYIVTRVSDGQTSAVDTETSQVVWETVWLGNQCEGINGHTGQAVAISGGDNVPEGGPAENGTEWCSPGDIAFDTLVDCISFDYWSAHADTDLDEDTIADGIPGFGMAITYYDSDNGGALDISTRIPVFQLVFQNLQGILDNPGFFAGRFFIFDLAGGNEFELGDSDGDFQGAAFGGVTEAGGPTGELGNDINADGNDDADIDGDGFFDFSRGVAFIQPGTFDFDGDGILDGDVADQASTAFGMSRANGYNQVSDGLGGWDIEVDDSVDAYARGHQPFAHIYTPGGDYNNLIVLAADQSCDAGAYLPYFSMTHSLFIPGETPCPADIDGNGELNFFDVGDFLADFAAGVDYNEDGTLNFFDVGDFLADFSAGCP